MCAKNQVLRKACRETFFGLLLTESLTASTLSRHLAVNFKPDLGFSSYLVKVVYWSCGFEFVYPTINLVYLGIIFKDKLPVKFWGFKCFCFQIKSLAKYFSSLIQGIVIENSWFLLYTIFKSEKKNAALLLVELLAVIWVLCILYWDTLYYIEAPYVLEDWL